MRNIALLSIGILLALCVFQPATAQGDAPYIDALSTQVALNTYATLTAAGQQQSAAAAQAQAAQAQAAAAAAQAQAAYAAQQATAQAGQQQAAIISAQSTADAAALLATAQVAQTRTAIEIQTTATGQALQARATSAAIEATRTAVAIQAAAQRSDNNAIATAVSGSVRATQTALTTQAAVDAQHLQTDRGLQIALLVGGLCIIICSVVVALYLLIVTAYRLKPRPHYPDPDVIIVGHSRDREHEQRMVAYRILYRQQQLLLLDHQDQSN